MDFDFPDLPHRTLQLDNGVRAALLHDAQATRVALAISVAPVPLPKLPVLGLLRSHRRL